MNDNIRKDKGVKFYWKYQFSTFTSLNKTFLRDFISELKGDIKREFLTFTTLNNSFLRVFN